MSQTKERFISSLTNSFFLRFHMSLILSIVLFSGFLSSRLFYYWGLENLTMRYSLSFLVSYFIFFLLIKIWLVYIFSSSTDSSINFNDSWFDFWPFTLGKSNGWSGSGGKSSGGGSSDSWDNPSSKAQVASIIGSQSSSSSKEFSLDIDDLGKDSAPLVVILLLLAIVLFSVGILLYLVFNAPMVMGDIAFQVALSIGVLKDSSRQNNPINWLSKAFEKTFWIAGIILLLIVVSTLVINYFNPDIHRSQELVEWVFKGLKELK